MRRLIPYFLMLLAFTGCISAGSANDMFEKGSPPPDTFTQYISGPPLAEYKIFKGYSADSADYFWQEKAKIRRDRKSQNIDIMICELNSARPNVKDIATVWVSKDQYTLPTKTSINLEKNGTCYKLDLAVAKVYRSVLTDDINNTLLFYLFIVVNRKGQTPNSIPPYNMTDRRGDVYGMERVLGFEITLD